MTLSLGPGLRLPADFATRRAAIIAKSGGGKTYTAAVLAEELVDAGQPFYALDPTGAWWGLRSSASGKRQGLPVIVIGGEHGDVPLDENSGAAIADLVVGEPSFYVIDLDGIETHAAEVRFATAFLDRLYRAKSKQRSALHGFWDEADLFAPQRPGPDQTKMLGAAESIIRRGRIRGLGTTLITQRPAVLNKNVLTQIDVLIALQVIGPQDRKAIREYLDGVADADLRDEVLGSLASLGLGEAWVYGPGLQPPLYRRVKVRERRTFNSSATGGGAQPEVKLADVDLDALRARLAATIEKAKADDPRELRRRLKERDARIAQLEEQTSRTPAPERVEVPVLTDEARDALDQAAGAITAAQDQMIEAIAEASVLLGGLVSELGVRTAPTPPPVPARTPAPARPAARPRVPAPASPPPAGDAGDTRSSGDFRPSTSQQRILDTLEWFVAVGIASPKRAALAPMAGTKSTSGGFKNNLGALRSAGLIDYPEPNRVALTDRGRAAATPLDLDPTAEALQAAVLASIPAARGAILRVLIDAYPDPVAREDLAAAVGVPPTSGGFKNNLGALRTLELIDYPQPGWVGALPILFLEGAAA
jgi:hypothetical protein